MVRVRAALLAAAIAILAGCGGSGPSTSSVPGGAGSASVEVIQGWVDSLRAGDVAKAAGYFRIPSIAINGPVPLKLDSRHDVLLFNASLPCGAVLTRAIDHEGFVIATFRLTERPGPGECGSGVGATAETAFKIVDGKIVEWRRVPEVPPTRPPPTSPVV
jgi:hypothetical protein